MMPLNVNAGGHKYPVYIARASPPALGRRIAETLPGSRAFVVSDDTVWRLYGEAVGKSLDAAGVRYLAEAVPAGEPSKSLETLSRLYSQMARAGFSRSDAVVAVGGGVVGDLAGMAAATFLRGMRFVQAPTSLLAQVDSSIGGKVAVDIPEGKNLVGAFHQPDLVLVDPDTLATLPDREFACGMAEVIKHAAIADAGLFAELEKHAGRQALQKRLPSVIRRNLAIKRAVVRRDERDAGPRMVLNFGHTLGHALEKQAGFTGITHGEAVAMGMCRITRVSEALGMTASGAAERLSKLCAAFGLPVEPPDGYREGILETMARDKKVRGGTVTLVLLKEIGRGFLHPVKLEEMGRFL
jgi:3-dehydroquinate synthase